MTAEETAKRFVSFALGIKRLFRSEFSSFGEGLTEERFRTLHFLSEGGDAGLTELSGRIRISPSSLCIMLGKLEEEGLVARVREGADRRRVLYRCTEAGSAALSRDKERRLGLLAARFEALDSGRRDRLARAMDELADVLQALESEGSSDGCDAARSRRSSSSISV